MVNISVFASGSGTNFQSIVNYFSGHEHIRINLLLSNRSGAAVLERAKKANIDRIVFTRDDLFSTGKVLDILKSYNTHFIVLAGFLWKIPDNIIKAYPDKIVNIHPALLPKYGGKGMYGMRVHEAVISSGEKYSGITIHIVNEEYDRGSIVSQHTCDVDPDDTPQSLAERIHKLEHYWYPRVIEKLVEFDS